MVRHFCACFSLKTGAIITAFLTLVLGASEIVIALIGLSDPEGGALKKVEQRLDAVCNGTSLCNFTKSEPILPTGEPGYEGNVTLYTVCLLLGVLTFFNGIVLIVGMVKANERYILLHVLMGSVGLLIVTIYTGMMMFSHAALTIIFLVSLFMCWGQLSMYHFYEEVAKYNSVNSGVIEITYNGDGKSYANSVMPTDDSVDNTVL